jgi:hypothetical protein
VVHGANPTLGDIADGGTGAPRHRHDHEHKHEHEHEHEHEHRTDAERRDEAE